MVKSVYWKKADGTGAEIQYPYYQSKKSFRTSQYIVVWQKYQDVLLHSITFAGCKAACFSGCCHPQFLAQGESNWGAKKAQNYITLYPLCIPNLTPTTVACRGLLAIYSWKLPSQHPHFRVSQTWWKLFIGCPQKNKNTKAFFHNSAWLLLHSNKDAALPLSALGLIEAGGFLCLTSTRCSV